MTIKMLQNELKTLINKYDDQPEIKNDLKRVIDLVADTLGEMMTLAAMNLRNKQSGGSR